MARCVLVFLCLIAGCDDGPSGNDGGLDGDLHDTDLARDAEVDGDTEVDGHSDGDLADADGLTDADGPDADRQPDAEALSCNTAAGEPPAEAETLQWDDGQPAASITEQSWQITVGVRRYVLSSSPLWEAARFELDHPARVLGFQVLWAELPEHVADTDPLEVGLFADFGHNGLDFWQFDPLWSGARCAGDVASGQWLTYMLDEPHELAQPGLVYVAHHRTGADSPAFFFDGSSEGEGQCALWDECHSAVNLNEAETASYFNGITLSIPFDYMVRLFVEYLDDLTAEEKIFQPVSDLSLGRRVSFGDYNNDGFDDLITTGPRLYANDGTGLLVDTTEASGIAAMELSGAGGVWGDFDNDGCLDLYIFSSSLTASDALLRSRCDGTFEDVTGAAGIVDEQDYNSCGDPANIRSPSPAAAWIDIDTDGFLDLYVSNYICGGEQESYYMDRVWRNRGDGTFEEISATLGFSDAALASRGASPVDANRDGYPDLFVNTYRLQRNLYFQNNGDGTVTEAAADVGLAGHADDYNGHTYYGHSIGVAWGDIDNDGDFDVIEANLAHPRFFQFSDKTRVLINDGTGVFTDIAGSWELPASEAGLRYQETHSSPVLADFDNDSSLDLVISSVYDGRPTDFYWGRGDGRFDLDVYHAGITTENGWGAAVADIENDGDLDLAESSLFLNTAEPEGHWLQVRAVGNVSSNWAAIGTTVEVHTSERSLIRHVQGGTGQGCQDTMYLHFGLGDQSSVTSVEVTYPGGTEVVYEGPFGVDQRLWVYEDGTTFQGWAPPR